jgi:hypothetical protein
MAAALICMLLGFYLKSPLFFKVSIILLVLSMIFPVIFRPFAVIWFWFSECIGAIMSKFILAVLFFILVVPVGLIRKGLGHDTMLLRQFKKGKQPGLIDKNHTYTATEFENVF